MELIIIQVSVAIICMNILTALYRRVMHKPKYDALYCGLFGFSGAHPPNMLKIKMLGLYNQSRGSHSCGYYYNGEVHKGVGTESKWEDFIQKQDIESIPKAKVFIGHTRYATIGQHTAENAHPFVFDNIIGAHNGKIENYWKLASDRNVDIRDCIVDSKAFIKVIGETGFDVINHYKGYAALLLTFPNDPNALYVYRGMSKQWSTDKEEREERPLFYLKQKEGIYVSSLVEALNAIRDNVTDTVYYVPANRVMKIKSGKFFHSEDVLITRGDINVGVTYVNRNQHGYWNNNPTGGYRANPNQTPTNHTTSTPTGGTTTILGTKLINPIIFQEGLPMGVTMGRVFYHKGRYWGVDQDNKHFLLDGKVGIDKKRRLVFGVDARGVSYYFFHGIMLKDKEAWEALHERRIQSDTEEGYMMHNAYKNAARVLSKYTEIPITNLTSESLNVTQNDRFSWWLNGVTYNGTFSPKFSNRHYNVKAGILDSITASMKHDKIFLQDAPEEIEEVETKKEDPVKPETEQKLAHLENVIANIRNLPIVEPEKSTIIVDKDGIATIEFEDFEINKVPPALRLMIKTWCDCVFDKPDFDQDLPSTIIDALGLYIDDVILNSNIVLDEASRERFTDDMYETIVRDGITIRDMVSTQYRTIDEYAYAAYLDEIADPNDDEDEVAPDKYDYGNCSCELMSFKEAVSEVEEEIKQAKVIDMEEEIRNIDRSHEDAMARLKMEELIDSIESLRKGADDMTAWVNSDIAQEAAQSIYQNVDNFIDRFSDVMSKLGETHSLKRLQSINTKH